MPASFPKASDLFATLLMILIGGGATSTASFAFGDKSTELQSTANAAARTGDTATITRSMEELINLASKQRKPRQQLTFLHLVELNLLFKAKTINNALPMDKPIGMLQAVLANQELLAQDERLEPEIKVELDDALNYLIRLGPTAPTVVPLEIADQMANQIAQFKEHRATLLQLKYAWLMAHGEFLKIESIARNQLKSLPPTEQKRWYARLYFIALKRNDKKGMKEAEKQLSKAEGWRHAPNDGGWEIDMAGVLYEAGAYDLALVHANKACAIFPKPSPGGSYGVSEGFGIRSDILRALKRYKEAEADARMSLRGSIGEAVGEKGGNENRLILTLEAQGKKAQADAFRGQKKRMTPQELEDF